VLSELLSCYLESRNNDPLRNPLDRGDENKTKQAFRLLAECFPDADSSNTDGDALGQFQIFLVQKGYARSQCNRFVKFIKTVFFWAAIQKTPLITEERAFTLRKVRALQPSPRIKENKPRKPVPENYFDSCLPLLRPVIADMLRLQLLHAMRPGEVCGIKPCDIDFAHDGINWLYTPEAHKTAGRGLERTIVLCKASQEILKRYMKEDEPGKAIFRNVRGNPFTTNIFDKIIRNTIKKHKLPKFTPYQVRHTVATKMAKRYGLEPTRALLGHADASMTRRYVDGDKDAIQQIADDRNREFEA
jgi:integrase